MGFLSTSSNFGGALKERNREIDILKAVGIILMVFNHVGWGIYVHTYIQSFHMPLFFIVSGYLWKQRVASDLFKKRLKSLLLPYGVFAVLYFIIAAVFNIAKNGGFQAAEATKAVLLFPTDNAHMPISPALWFLPCMFLTSVIYTALGHLNLVKKAVAIIAIAITGAIYSEVSDYMLPFCIEPTAAALFFMLIGELIREKTITKYLSNSYFVVGLLILEAVLAFMNKSVDLRSARFNMVPLFFLNGVMGTLAYWGISRRIEMQKRIGWIRRELIIIGQHSISFLCTHQFFILVLKKCFVNLLERGTLFEAGMKAVIWILTIFFCRVIAKSCKESKYIRMFFGLS